MRQTSLRILQNAKLLFLIAYSIFAAGEIVSGQTPSPQASPPPPPVVNDPRAEAILSRAISALGGEAYLNIRTVVSRGNFTQFQAGRPLPPSSFVDYLAFPDRERTEFRTASGRVVQTNTGATGWIYDGARRQVRDIRPEQAADFRVALRSSVDNILRGWWRAEGASLTYVGRREAGLARRNEVVRLAYPDGFSVEFEFSAQDNLPAKSLYTRRNAEGEEAAEEDRFFQYVLIEGVRAPLVVDHYRAGQQTSRINYVNIQFNQPIPESLFARPADARAVR
jgi:hypothetical protein